MAIVVLLLVLNIVLAAASLVVTRRNRRTLEEHYARERKATQVMHDAALDKGKVLTLFREGEPSLSDRAA